MIDMRSDTVTKPTDDMRRAMAAAEVGDDVYGDDVTVNRLETLAAEMLGKEAALFVPSGTMGNLTALLTHTVPGQEIILGEIAHIHLFEVSGYGRYAGLGVKIVDDTSGLIDPDEIEQNILKSFNIHNGGTGLICIENTHNIAGGICVDAEHLMRIRAIADRYHLPVHMDGARLFNAAVYLNDSAAHLARAADSVMFCLSKGLAAPVGSMLCGKKEFISRARHIRKSLGGGMRQAGILAAAGIVALEDMTKRLYEDHENAKLLAEGLANIEGFVCDADRVQTNIIMTDVNRKGNAAAQVCEALEKEGILISAFGEKRLRFTLNYHITKDDVKKTLSVLNRI